MKSEHWQPGLSPHAPYTVHPELLARAVDLSVEHEIPLAMHLAESREEIDFLRDGRGPFRELLESRGAWDPTARPRGARPLDELRVLARAHRALVVHGNYLDDEEIDFLGRQRRQMAVVYCPRTHAWFAHARYPLEKLLAAGAIVALGTDSRASSPDLSLLAEMRHVAREFPAMSRATILELGTLGGARALGLDSQIGTLEPGKWANLAAIALPEDAAADPHELLLDAAGRGGRNLGPRDSDLAWNVPCSRNENPASLAEAVNQLAKRAAPESMAGSSDIGTTFTWFWLRPSGTGLSIARGFRRSTMSLSGLRKGRATRSRGSPSCPTTFTSPCAATSNNPRKKSHWHFKTILLTPRGK